MDYLRGFICPSIELLNVTKFASVEQIGIKTQNLVQREYTGNILTAKVTTFSCAVSGREGQYFTLNFQELQLSDYLPRFCPSIELLKLTECASVKQYGIVA